MIGTTMTNQPASTPATTARSTAKATITIGLLSVPVKLYTTKESSNDISFNMHHDKDAGRLKQQYVCTVCDEVVDREHTTKGYEHSKGQSVIFTAPELAAIELVTNGTINVQEFVEAGDVDPIYFGDAHYLGPDKGAETAFQLVHDALLETGKVGIGVYGAHGKERLGMVRPYEGGLAYHQLRFASEVRSSAGVPRAEIETRPSNLVLAKDLVTRMSVGSFDPSAFRDSAQARILGLIKSKVDGGEIVVTPVEPAAAADIVDALRASLEQFPNDIGAPTRATTKRAPKARVASINAKKSTTAHATNKRQQSRRAASSR